MQSPAEKIWKEAQEKLRSILNPDIYNLWFAPIQALCLDGETITLRVANDFCELWLKDNYLTLVQDVLMHVAGAQIKVRFQIG